MTYQNESNPRWGEKDREKKADAIFYTLQHHRDGKGGETWIDVGCGSGGIAVSLASRVGRVVGIDPEPWARWAEYKAEFSNLEFYVGSYKDILNFVASAAADVVICNQVYEHVDDPIALLQAIKCVLKPGGICYFAGPNFLWPLEPHVFWPFVHWLPRAFAQRLMKRLGSREAARLDAYSWSFRKLTSAFREVDLRYASVIQSRLAAGLENSGNHNASRFIYRLPRSLFRILTPLAPGFVFVLTKPP